LFKFCDEEDKYYVSAFRLNVYLFALFFSSFDV